MNVNGFPWNTYPMAETEQTLGILVKSFGRAYLNLTNGAPHIVCSFSCNVTD